MQRQARASMSSWVRVWPVTHGGDCPAVILEEQELGLQGARTPCPDTGLCLRLKTSNTSSLHFTLENRWRTRGGWLWGANERDEWALQTVTCSTRREDQAQQDPDSCPKPQQPACVRAPSFTGTPVLGLDWHVAAWKPLENRLGPCFLSVVATAIGTGHSLCRNSLTPSLQMPNGVPSRTIERRGLMHSAGPH